MQALALLQWWHASTISFAANWRGTSASSIWVENVSWRACVDYLKHWVIPIWAPEVMCTSVSFVHTRCQSYEVFWINDVSAVTPYKESHFTQWIGFPVQWLISKYVRMIAFCSCGFLGWNWRGIPPVGGNVPLSDSKLNAQCVLSCGFAQISGLFRWGRREPFYLVPAMSVRTWHLGFEDCLART